MKNILHTITALISLLVITSAAASDDFSFVVQPEFGNINCGAAPSQYIFTVKNNQQVPVKITYLNFSKAENDERQTDPFPDDLLTVDTDASTCRVGSNVSAMGTCDIAVTVTPEPCGLGPTEGEVRRLLHVGIDTWQKEIISDVIVFEYTTLGAGDGFAILGQYVSNFGPVSTTSGSVGHTGNASIVGAFNVMNGELYEDADDPVVVSANDSLLAAYEMFQENQTNCRLLSEEDFPVELQASYYCLTSQNDIDLFPIDAAITLSGNGYFVFYVDDGQGSCFDEAPHNNTPCGLEIRSSTEFHYKNGASPEKVVWVLGNGELLLNSGAILDGTVLSSDLIRTSSHGPSPALINGRLWTQGAIALYGDTVAVPGLGSIADLD